MYVCIVLCLKVYEIYRKYCMADGLHAIFIFKISKNLSNIIAVSQKDEDLNSD